MKNNRIYRTVFSVTSVLALSKLMGFAKQMLTASTFGTTLETDIIGLAQGLIGDVQYVLAQSLMTALIAVYIHTAKNDQAESNALISDTIKVFIGFVAIAVTVVIIFAPQLAQIIAPSYTGNTAKELIRYLRIFAPTLFFMVLICIFQSVLHTNKRFIPGELVGLNQSLITIIIILIFSGSLGPTALGLAFYCYAVWNTLYLGVASRKLWKYQNGNPLKNASLRKLLRMMFPMLLGYSVVYVNQMVDKMLVSGLGEGAVTALSYAAVLSNLVGTFIVTFASMLFPYITKYISLHQDEHAAQQTEQVTALLLLAFTPISVLTILCAEDIITIAFGRGAFDVQSVRMAAMALRGYGFSMLPLILREMYARVQYGYQDTKSPMINSTIGIIVNILLSILLSSRLGILGITLASSISGLICGTINLLAVKKYNAYFRPQTILRLVPWLIVGSVGCLISAYCVTNIFTDKIPLFRFTFAALCGMISYALLVGWKILHVFWQYRNQDKKKWQSNLHN